jgi:serine/threonine protein kinase
MAVIRTATDNFSHQNKIGEGGFGEVYKVRKHEKVYLFYDKVLCVNDGLFSN